MHKILVVGQTPPPFGGQSIMIEKILRQEYSLVELTHVRLNFSEEMEEIGRFKLRKIWHLISSIINIVIAKLQFNTTILYYPPAGPDKLPMYRDFAILICTRWLFKKTIFHFHAGGISEVYPTLSRIEKLLFRVAYYRPDGSILLSDLNPRDDLKLHSRKSFVVPYGIEDSYYQLDTCSNKSIPTILSVGIIKESKGVLVLIEALKVLKAQGIEFEAKFVGEFESIGFRGQVLKKLNDHGLNEYVSFTGVLTGDQKWREFSNSDIFCFPTFFESETFGLVVLEAMQFNLPVIASNWRGVPSLVKDGETGFVVQAKESHELSEKLKLLCEDTALAKTMGKNGRDEFLRHYSIDTFRQNIENTFVSIAEAPRY